MIRTASRQAELRWKFTILRVSVTLCALIATFLCLASSAGAQERLDTIVQRGYVAHWLVCGPFTPDAEGGIAGALKAGRAALADKDYMKALGGVNRTRPTHLLKVSGEATPATWQQAGTTDESLDLAPFFPDAKEGVAYAAFYAQSTSNRTVYLDLQTPLGVRVWLNGFLVREIRSAPVTVTGVDRFLAQFRPGDNLLMLEVPGARYEVLAEAAHLAPADFKAQGFQNRPLLKGKSGFEIALRISAVEQLGTMMYAPLLRSTGTFSGAGPSLLRQDAALLLFNPTDAPSPPIALEARSAGAADRIQLAVPPVPAQSAAEAVLAIPIAGLKAGDAAPVEVTLRIGEQGATFTAPITVHAPPESGTMYIVSGSHYARGHALDQRADVEDRIDSLARQLVLLDKEPEYGFDLGAVDEWKPFWDSHPAERKTLAQAVTQGRCAAHAGFALPDERLVTGELLVQNLVYGQAVAQRILGASGNCYYAWDAPALCSQAPQLFAQASIKGVISNLPCPGLSEIAWLEAPGGARILHRRKQAGPGPKSIDQLRDQVAVQRRELLERGLDTDVMVIENAMPPPEPFYLGATDALAHAAPAIKISGDGGGEFFRTSLERIQRAPLDIPVTARSLMGYEPGAVIAQTNLKQAHSFTETRVLTAERFATFAALLGATYPDSSLDAAWRQLLYWSAPDHLGFAATGRGFVDQLAAYRETAELAGTVLSNSLHYIADQADTYAGAPDKSEGAFALVAFNPSSWRRTDVCITDVPVEGLKGLTLLDESGKPVPYWTERTSMSNAGGSMARLHYVAAGVPAMGYRTIYAAPGKQFTGLVTGPGVQIENEFFTIIVDPERGGSIVSLVPKDSGRNCVKGLWNDVVALEEDPAKNNRGRDLWTTGTVTRASAKAAKVTVSKVPGIERMTITTPFLGGNLIRELTIYSRVPRIDCDVRLDKVPADKGLITVAFDGAGSDGQAPVFGDRFGVRVGRSGCGLFDLRTTAGKNVSGTGVEPALRWMAVSPNDHLQVGMDAAVPLGPTMIITGSEPGVQRAARELQSALIARGIPCSISLDAPRKLNTIWTDSSELPNFNDDLDYGTAFRIVLGSQGQNLVCKGLCSQLDGDASASFSQRLVEGAMLFLYDRDVPEGHAPLPTLILAGETDSRTAELAGAVAESLRTDGVVQVPPDAYLPAERRSQPEKGLAVLFGGAALTGMESDGTLLLGLRHAGQWTEAESEFGEAIVAEAGAYRYAVYPFAGTWRDAGVARAAHGYAEPFVAVPTKLRLAQQPTEQRFLELKDPNFIVTSVRPSALAAMVLSTQEVLPQNGIAVRGYESISRRWESSLDLFVPIRAAGFTNLLGRSDDTVGFNNMTAVFTCDPLCVKTLGLIPAARLAKGPVTDLNASMDAESPRFTRFWRHNTGAAPAGFQPVTLALEGNLSAQDASVDLVIANNVSDVTINGAAFVSASQGWAITPNQVEYTLGPGESQRAKIVVLRNVGKGAPGGLVARTDYDGHTYMDVLDEGESPLEMSVTRIGREVRVLVQNRGSLPAQGYVDLVAPGEFTTEMNPASVGTVAPRRAALAITPFQEQRLVFLTAEQGAPTWMVAKLAANGHVMYRGVRP